MHDILSEGCEIEPRRQPIPALAALRSKREEEFGNKTYLVLVSHLNKQD